MPAHQWWPGHRQDDVLRLRRGRNLWCADRTIGTKQLRPNALQWTDDAQLVVVDAHYSDESALHLMRLVSDSAVYAVAANKRAATLKPNHMNFAFLTGDLDFLPVKATNRRFVAIEAPPRRQCLF